MFFGLSIHLMLVHLPKISETQKHYIENNPIQHN
jgi:hypothetical protein